MLEGKSPTPRKVRGKRDSPSKIQKAEDRCVHGQCGDGQGARPHNWFYESETSETSLRFVSLMVRMR